MATKKYFILLFYFIVSWRSEGQPAKQQLTAREVKEKISRKNPPILIDLRTPEETKKGIISGAKIKNYYDSDFDVFLSRLDKKKEYVFYCAIGGRSHKATIKATQRFKLNVKNLTGGMHSWRKLFPDFIESIKNKN